MILILLRLDWSSKPLYSYEGLSSHIHKIYPILRRPKTIVFLTVDESGSPWGVRDLADAVGFSIYSGFLSTFLTYPL
jgi:hypothetical protein